MIFIDASHPAWEEHRQVVEQVLTELEAHEKNVLHVFNKIDRLDDAALRALQERMANVVPGSVFVSATEDGGLEPLRRSLLGAVRTLRPVAELRIPATDGRLMAEVHRLGEVIDQESVGEDMLVRARLDSALLGRLKRQGVVVNGA